MRLQCLNSHGTEKRTYFKFLLWSHIQDCYTATLLQQVILWVVCCLLSAVLSDVWSHSICRSQHVLYKLHLCQWIKELMLSGWREEPKYEVQLSEGTIPVSAAFPGLLCVLTRGVGISCQNVLEQTFPGWNNLYSNKCHYLRVKLIRKCCKLQDEALMCNWPPQLFRDFRENLLVTQLV